MRDFNTVCSELVRHLRLSVQRHDGDIWWYEGTLELLTELLSFATSKPKTHADRIRAMSDEELARFIHDQIIDRNIGIPTETWLDWLRQEADNGQN